ncbi:ABC transporter substrate-binding protein [Vallitalea longa]|uniref:ABC transporter substrate-binding protein n=1 Tax=Vallitalea longa TaxID=2936439 RepID=A0A9W5YEE3_9FIRM|nr:tripartite tricarboxylate transporter substrate binding protein [Vallitalea longa]GKX29683.1 ABC transporter substrate-binding protein [Vallitalea longa]
MKKIISIFTLICCILSFTACSSKEESVDTKVDDTTKEEGVDFPTKAIEIVVPFSAGGGTDTVARALAESAKNEFDESVVVVNKTGGGGAVGMSEGANAKADGHIVTMITVELTTLPNLGVATFTYEDYKPVLQINADPATLTVKADAPWDTLDEFIEYAKEHPGEIKIGNSGVGAIWHLAAVGIENETDTKFNHVPFDGAAPATVALLGGHIDAVTVSPAEVLPHVKNGELKVLGVLSDERIEELSEVKTFKEQGHDLSIGTWRGLGVPKDTPDEVVDILKEGFMNAANNEDFKEVLNNLGLGYKVEDNEVFGETIKADQELFKELIEKFGLNN